MATRTSMAIPATTQASAARELGAATVQREVAR